MSLENERRISAMLWGGEAHKRATEKNIKHLIEFIIDAIE
jgi:hypothetical protein